MLLGPSQGKTRRKKKQKGKEGRKIKTKEKVKKEKKPNLGDVESPPSDGMETSLGAMLWCQPAERCVTPSEPRCGVGQRDVKLCWCRIAASANRTKNSVGATLWHRPTGHRNLLEPRCGIGQQDVRCMDSVGVVLRHWPTEKVELR